MHNAHTRDTLEVLTKLRQLKILLNVMPSTYLLNRGKPHGKNLQIKIFNKAYGRIYQGKKAYG